MLAIGRCRWLSDSSEGKSLTPLQGAIENALRQRMQVRVAISRSAIDAHVRTTALAQLLCGVGNANRFRDHQRGLARVRRYSRFLCLILAANCRASAFNLST